ncbi:malto-oligosyltrehalose synthase [Streptomyces sp. NPDC050560]|uniref:malto-oligosyltrehalose synthase n=1 Tax=Streptomyces sp. NPDC050560 TaxID=3365630 RepID=UPI003795D534
MEGPGGAGAAPRAGAVPVRATYRLQLQPGFPFAAAESAVPHLALLGVSHLHLSPILEAVPGSTHGYDVVDHARVRGELGGEEGLRRLARTAREHGLGLVVDIVPNHMAASPRHNAALRDVLRHGRDSAYARWFDVDWEAGGGRLLLPVLGAPLGRELAALRVEDGVLHLGGQEFPLRPGTEDLPPPALLDAQHYRLCWWRLARTELNYRRFFTISELIGLRVEDPEVFDATHATVLGLLREGVVDGLRVDHPDGLADPGGYLERLHKATGGAWTVVEKVLADGERLPASWPVAGTTGYDALRHVDGVLTDGAGAAELARGYRAFAAPAPDLGGDWAATVRRAAYRVVTHDLAAEMDRLTRVCARVCALDPGLRDHAPWALRRALGELLVRLPVYRPYGAEDAALLLPWRTVEEAEAAFEVPEEAAAVRAVRGLLAGGDGAGAGAVAGGVDEADGAGAGVRELRARFAQVASALRAKSVEDSAFYRYPALLSATEVGGEPGRPALEPRDFHAYCARVQRDWPGTGTVLSTHDTKRSADVRAAIAVLAECPERWAALLDEVTAAASGAPAPDGATAWAAWQTAVGIGPVEPRRLVDALLKQVREAGLRTTWTEPDAGYEEAVTAFAAAAQDAAAGPLAAFARELREPVRARVLAAALLHLTMPGVPELYQGTERVYRALVDPDNRAPAAFDAEALRALAADGAGLDGEKAALTLAALGLRARRPEAFGERGGYTPRHAEGPAAAHLLAFTRADAALTAVVRLPLRLARAGGWRGTALVLPPGVWRDTGPRGTEHEGRTAADDLFAGAPAVLLERTG